MPWIDPPWLLTRWGSLNFFHPRWCAMRMNISGAKDMCRNFSCPGLRRSIRDPSVRPKPCRALRDFDQCPIEEAAQTGAVCATFFDRSFPTKDENVRTLMSIDRNYIFDFLIREFGLNRNTLHWDAGTVPRA